MPRKNKNARSLKYKQYTFKEYCRLIGVTPKQRVLLIRRFRKESLNKGGEKDYES